MKAGIECISTTYIIINRLYAHVSMRRARAHMYRAARSHKQTLKPIDKTLIAMQAHRIWQRLAAIVRTLQDVERSVTRTVPASNLSSKNGKAKNARCPMHLSVHSSQQAVTVYKYSTPGAHLSAGAGARSLRLPVGQRRVCVATARAIATLLLPRAFTIWASLFPFAHFLPRAPTARATPHQNYI